MKESTNKPPEIPEAEQTPLVQMLLLIILEQQKRIGELKEEVERLKGHKGRPKIKPSQMDKQGKESNEERKPGPKKSKTGSLAIGADRVIAPEGLPENPKAHGWRFKGYNDYVVQELKIEAQNIRYRLEQWQGPNGEYLAGKLPKSVEGHYGSKLKSYVLYSHHHQRVPQPLLLQQLREWGIEISSGQLSNLLTEGQSAFHNEKAQLLETGLQFSNHIHVDDTGARHNGKNGYCTHIGNELFAWFESTQSKSRENFLSLLRAGSKDYVLNAGALEYMAKNKLAKEKLESLDEERHFADRQAWEKYLKKVGITKPRHVRIATEGALMGSILAHGLSKDMAVMSDDAGQFNVFRHALCWIHAERNINKLVPLNGTHVKHVNWVRSQIWDLYADLKCYKTDESLQTKAFREEIRARFDEICRTRTRYTTLNGHLKRLAANKTELLRVLDDPSLPLHNNLSERDIREYVSRRKISGSTRSDEGRRCRDTFASLKKNLPETGHFVLGLPVRQSLQNQFPAPSIPNHSGPGISFHQSRTLIRSWQTRTWNVSENLPRRARSLLAAWCELRTPPNIPRVRSTCRKGEVSAELLVRAESRVFPWWATRLAGIVQYALGAPFEYGSAGS